MASEHGTHHRWNADRARCLDCGRDAEDIADELQQQLQEARAENERLEERLERVTQQIWNDYAQLKQRSATMHALLWRIPQVNAADCSFCLMTNDGHAPDCPIGAVMQWRAKGEEASDGE